MERREPNRHARPPRRDNARTEHYRTTGYRDTETTPRRDHGLLRGTIKRLVRDRYFGFVRDSQGGEYFFHKAVLQPGTEFDVLSEGDIVEFRPEASTKGPRCGYVQLATTPVEEDDGNR